MLQTISRKAFTMIELIMVIIILGIVSSIGAGIIAQVFESYIIQRAVHNASFKTELAINQLANRLAYRIDKSMLARHPGSTGLTTADVYPTQEVPLDQLNFYSALEWISYDNDGFSSFTAPTWSGFADLNSTKSSFSTLSSPGSDFISAYTSKTMKHYTGTADGSGGAIVFLGVNDYREDATTGDILPYNAPCMYSNNGCIFPVTVAGNTLSFTTAGDRVLGEMIYSEFYQFATSSFAVVPENPHTINGITVWDLELYYAYQPWEGETYVNNAKHSTLIRNISVFRFRKEENSIRLKICSVEPISQTEQVAICKEKAVIR